MAEWLFMRDFQNAFDAALAGVDSTIVEVDGALCTVSPRGHSVAEKFRGFLTIRSRWDLPVAGSVLKEAAPSLFVRTDTVRAVRRGDTLTINGEDVLGGSCFSG